MTERRRQSDVEIAVLSGKMETFSERLLSHMRHEEIEHKAVWDHLNKMDCDINKLDRKLLFFSTLILTTAGGPNIAEYLHLFM